jgi:DNA repair protein RadC
MAEYRVGLKDLPESVRPRERLMHAGPSALSNSELLAIILRTGGRSGNVLISPTDAGRVGDWAGSAPRHPELCRHDGMGEVKSTKCKQPSSRAAAGQPEPRRAPQIRSPQDIANLVKAEMSALGQEHLRVLLLNTKNHVVGSHDVYRGSLNTAVVRVGELFREAIRQNCAAMVLVHNHPSGDPTPSPEDVDLTRQVVEAGTLLDVSVLDHLIIGRGRWVREPEGAWSGVWARRARQVRRPMA